MPITKEQRIANLGKNAKKGNIPWNKGRTGIYSEETLNRMSDAKKKNPTKYWLGKSREDMFGENHPMWGKVREDMRGENNPLWNGGSSRAYKDGYYSVEYKHWRTKVFKRDNYTCQMCGESGCYVTAHHVKSFAHHEALRFDVDNGLTLCEPCHASTDNYKGRAIKGD